MQDQAKPFRLAAALSSLGMGTSISIINLSGNISVIKPGDIPVNKPQAYLNDTNLVPVSVQAWGEHMIMVVIHSVQHL